MTNCSPCTPVDPCYNCGCQESCNCPVPIYTNESCPNGIVGSNCVTLKNDTEPCVGIFTNTTTLTSFVDKIITYIKNGRNRFINTDGSLAISPINDLCNDKANIKINIDPASNNSIKLRPNGLFAASTSGGGGANTPLTLTTIGTGAATYTAATDTLNIPTPASSIIPSTRFGIEDNLGTQNRLFNLQDKNLEFVSGDYIDYNLPTSLLRIRPTSFDYYTQTTGDNSDAGFYFSPTNTQISQGQNAGIFNQLRLQDGIGMILLSDSGPDFRSKISMNGPSMFLSSSSLASDFFSTVDFRNQRVQVKQSSFDEILNVSTANFTKNSGEYTVVKSVNGVLADATGNVTVAGGNPVIPFYNNNTDAIANGAALNSMYRLPYLTPGDYYPLALVGPGLQTFSLTMGDNCNISTLSANVVMTNTLTGNIYNFVLTRPTFNTTFDPITITILQGNYSFTLSNT